MEPTRQAKPDLKQLADLAMASHGLEAQFPENALKQLAGLTGPAKESDPTVKDLKNLLWCSIDNDDSRDLDQLSVAEKLPDGSTKVYVSVADVDALVKLGTPLDLHARKNTTSVYTGVKTYPMLPEQLSTDWTSLNADSDRISLVMEMTLSSSGELTSSQVYRAWVRNQAKLTYNGVGAWLEGKGPLPPAAAKVPGLDGNLRLQDEAAQKLKALRHQHGALELETLQPRPVTEGNEVVNLSLEMKNRAGELIEDFMIAANGVTARFLTQNGFPTLRRVVKIPERWDRIVELAEEQGDKLPAEPDSKALNEFLKRSKEKDPLRFPDLSLMVVKLMGRGEYQVEAPGQTPVGHFGLAAVELGLQQKPGEADYRVHRRADLMAHHREKFALGLVGGFGLFHGGAQ